MAEAKNLVAIDISDSDLKIAQMRYVNGKPVIVNLATSDITGLVEADLVKILTQQLQRLNATKAKAVVVIPSSLTITKNIEIPSHSPSEIREIIDLQAARHTPYSRDEVIVDYVNIGAYRKNYSRVLLVIATRAAIRKQLDLIYKTGLKIANVCFGPEGISAVLSRDIKFDTPDLPVSFIHVNSDSTDFIIAKDAQAVFIRNIPIGAKHLLEDKDKYGAKFIDEVKKSLEAYKSEDIDTIPGEFLLIGAVEGLTHLTDALNTGLGITTKSAPYLKKLTVSKQAANVGSSYWRLSFLSVISSLLVHKNIKIDLLPEEMKLERTIESRSKEIIKTGILIMISFVLVYAALISKIYTKTGYLNDLSAEYEKIHKQADGLEEKSARNQIIRNFVLTRGYSLEVLADVYEAMPDQLRIGYIRFDTQGAFSIEGTAGSIQEVVTFVDSLGDAAYFKKVETRYTRKNTEGGEDLTDFALTCVLNPAQ